MSQESNHLPAGAVLHGGKRKYTVTRVLGQGGFGITYHAMGDVVVDGIETKAEFAIKEFFKSDHCYRDGDSLSMSFSRNSVDIVTDTMNDFETEARRLFKLPSHPGIVKVSEVFSDNNTRYYAMQYLGNRSLDRIDVPMAEDDAVALIDKIGEAVQFLHDHQITHLDIKPQNIIMRDEQPVLIDFGLSRHYDNRGQATKSSFNGGGYSEGYSPIEQYAGISRFSPECDVYALAATLFFLLTGSRPVGAIEISPEWINENLPASISPSTRRAICHATEQRARDRASSVNEFLDELHSPVVIPAEEPEIIIDTTVEGPDSGETVRIDAAADKRGSETNYLHSEDVESSGKSSKKAGWIAAFVGAVVVIGAVIALRGNSEKAASETDITVPVDTVEVQRVEGIEESPAKVEPKETPKPATPQKAGSSKPAQKPSSSGPKKSGSKPSVTPVKDSAPSQPAQGHETTKPESSNSQQQQSAPQKEPSKKPAPPTIDPMSGKYF